MAQKDYAELNIGIVGLHFGKWMARRLAAGDAAGTFRLAAVCDRIEERARQQADEHGVRFYTDLDELLANPDIPVIGLFTGPVGRADLIRKIMAAGKDIMTTKPFERDPDQALAVLHEARKAGRVIHMNSPSTLPSPMLEQVFAWDKEFGLGKPIAYRTNMWRLSPEQPDGTWYDDPVLCPVAPIFRLGIYSINDGLRIFGEAEAVQVLSSRIFTGRPTADNAQLTVQFKNGGILSVYASFAAARHRYPNWTSMINFEHATIYGQATPTTGGLPGSTELTLVFGNDNDVDPQVVRKSMPASRDYQWDNFRRVIAGEKLPGAVTPEQIVHGLRVIEAMARAEANGTTETVV